MEIVYVEPEPPQVKKQIYQTFIMPPETPTEVHLLIDDQSPKFIVKNLQPVKYEETD